MFKEMVQSSFQKATVGSNNDELTLAVSRLRSQVNDMRNLMREMAQEMDRLRRENAAVADLRNELSAMRANGFVSQGSPSLPAARHPIVVPDAVLDATPAQAAPSATASAPTAAAPSSIAASIALDAQGKSNAPVSDLNPDGINYAADGKAFWGLINNESARNKAAGKTLIIDQPECISCGTCVEQTDHVFILPDDGKAVAREQTGPMDFIQDAIEACPVTCIHWTETPDKFEKLNDKNGAKLS